MNNSFPRILTLLRKERGLSQKAASVELGISQALLSHYEKGIRECGLDFLCRAADFYGVSCDYLLGRSVERTGAQLTVEDIPEPDAIGRENIFRGSVLPTLHKKLIANSLNIIYDKLMLCGNKGLTNEASAFLMLAVYRLFRLLYDGNQKNPASTFAIPGEFAQAGATAQMLMAEANLHAILAGTDFSEFKGLEDPSLLEMTPELLSKQYPLFASSLMNVLQLAEQRMGKKPPRRDAAAPGAKGK